MEWESREPIAKLGDIVKVKGYPRKTYEVITVYYEREVYPTEEFESVSYELSGMGSDREFMIADMEDVTIIETPKEVDYERLEFLSEANFKFTVDIYQTLLNQTRCSEDEDEYLPTKEQMDELLDLYNQYSRVIDLFERLGRETELAEFIKKRREVELELQQFSE